MNTYSIVYIIYHVEGPYCPQSVGLRQRNKTLDGWLSGRWLDTRIESTVDTWIFSYRINHLYL